MGKLDQLDYDSVEINEDFRKVLKSPTKLKEAMAQMQAQGGLDSSPSLDASGHNSSPSLVKNGPVDKEFPEPQRESKQV